jgi:hypothetical protein
MYAKRWWIASRYSATCCAADHVIAKDQPFIEVGNSQKIEQHFGNLLCRGSSHCEGPALHIGGVPPEKQAEGGRGKAERESGQSGVGDRETETSRGGDRATCQEAEHR